jgi:hypothetical protein
LHRSDLGISRASGRGLEVQRRRVRRELQADFDFGIERHARQIDLFDFPGQFFVALLAPKSFHGGKTTIDWQRSDELHLLPTVGAVRRFVHE